MGIFHYNNGRAERPSNYKLLNLTQNLLTFIATVFEIKYYLKIVE